MDPAAHIVLVVYRLDLRGDLVAGSQDAIPLSLFQRGVAFINLCPGEEGADAPDGIADHQALLE